MSDVLALELPSAVTTFDPESLYREHRQGLFSLALTVTRDPERAEDAVHEAFVRLVERGVPEGADPAAYAFGAVRNAAVDQLRRRRPSAGPASLYAVEEDGPDRGVIADEEDRRLAAAVEALPDEEREVVVLYVHGSLGFAQVAEVVGASLSTVHGRYRRALERLRRELGEESA